MLAKIEKKKREKYELSRENSYYNKYNLEINPFNQYLQLLANLEK